MRRIFKKLKPYFSTPSFIRQREWTGFTDKNGKKIYDGDEIELVDAKKRNHKGSVRINVNDKDVYFLDKSPYGQHHYEQISDIIRKNHGEVEIELL